MNSLLELSNIDSVYRSSSLSSSLAGSDVAATSSVNDDGNTVFCQHHGNCPIGTVCATYHKCLPYESISSSVPSNFPRLEACIDACLKELTVEEGYQYQSRPVMQSTSEAREPHSGCVVYYHREKLTDYKEPERLYILAQRERSVVRVDPTLGQPGHWMALCRHPCQRNGDCERGLECMGRKAYDESPPKQNHYNFTKTCQPEFEVEPVRDPVIASGADSKYFSALRNMAASVRYWAPQSKLLIFNLGMTLEELRRVKSWPNLEKLY